MFWGLGLARVRMLNLSLIVVFAYTCGIPHPQSPILLVDVC